jgi:hypothetical protein
LSSFELKKKGIFIIILFFSFFFLPGLDDAATEGVLVGLEVAVAVAVAVFVLSPVL